MPGKAPSRQQAGPREIFAWAMFDFANSGYTTVVLTAVFNVYFVSVVAGQFAEGSATLLWTIAVGIANALVLLSAPFLGALADERASKKGFLALSTVGCVLTTALLAVVGPGDVALGMVLLVLSAFLFATGEDLIAAFLPEIATVENMGRISGYGWSLGYIGGLLVLALCLAYNRVTEAAGLGASEFVSGAMLIVAASYAVASIPTFVWLKERAVPTEAERGRWTAAFTRLRHTLAEARRFRDLFRLLAAITTYTCGVHTVVVLAAVYARQVAGFDNQETLVLILVVNIAASAGAFLFGHLQDRIGSVRTLGYSLLIWIAATGLAIFATSKVEMWVVGHLIGFTMGASQSAGRALVGQFTPRTRTAEFFGLWGVAVKLSAVIGPLTYGLIDYLTGGNHRLALVSTLVFFVAGLALLRGISEDRGRNAAHNDG